jgi:hypothetical protein
MTSPDNHRTHEQWLIDITEDMEYVRVVQREDDTPKEE